MKFISGVLLFIAIAILFGMVIDFSNQEQKTFTVTNKYTKVECVNVICLREQMNYYLVTEDNKTYYTIDEAKFDKFEIGKTYTVNLIPSRGFILEILSGNNVTYIPQPTTQEALQGIFQSLGWWSLCIIPILGFPLLVRLARNSF